VIRPLTSDPDKLMYFYFGQWQGQGSNLGGWLTMRTVNGTIEDSENKQYGRTPQ